MLHPSPYSSSQPPPTRRHCDRSSSPTSFHSSSESTPKDPWEYLIDHLPESDHGANDFVEIRGNLEFGTEDDSLYPVLKHDTLIELSLISARLLEAKNDDNIRAAYAIPKEERYVNVLLGYEPTYTSYLQKTKKKSRSKTTVEEAEPSHKRKRDPRGIRKAVVAVEVSSNSEIDLHREEIQKLVGKIRELREEEEEEEEKENMGGNFGDLPKLMADKKKPRIKKTTISITPIAAITNCGALNSRWTS